MRRNLSQHTMSGERRTVLGSRLRRLASASMLLLSSVMLPVAAAQAQTPAILAQGDAVVTGFSGIKPLDAPVRSGADPLDSFFIDLDGPSMQILQLGALEGRPQGQ